jgi:hypothetical protein
VLFGKDTVARYVEDLRGRSPVPIPDPNNRSEFNRGLKTSSNGADRVHNPNEGNEKRDILVEISESSSLEKSL